MKAGDSLPKIHHHVDIFVSAKNEQAHSLTTWVDQSTSRTHEVGEFD
jgi:hypothetical protein